MPERFYRIKEPYKGHVKNSGVDGLFKANVTAWALMLKYHLYVGELQKYCTAIIYGTEILCIVNVLLSALKYIFIYFGENKIYTHITRV